MKLLVVEDSAGHAVLVRFMLDEAAPGEYEISHVASLAEAVRLLLGPARPEVDCILLDLGLPDAEGLAALAQVRTAALDAPVVVHSGHDDDELALAAVREGAQDYIVKGGADGRALNRALRAAVERARLGRERAHQALHDPLTALPNRTLFFDRLRQALSRNGRTQGCLAVMFLDLDGFKTVNDTRGHAAGDALLVSVADRLADVLRGGDTAARIGGDEFVVLCEDVTGHEEARGIAARVLEEVPLAASLGVALAAGGMHEPDALVRDADAAMYAVKRAGGGAFALVEAGGRLAI